MIREIMLGIACATFLAMLFVMWPEGMLVIARLAALTAVSGLIIIAIWGRS